MVGSENEGTGFGNVLQTLDFEPEEYPKSRSGKSLSEPDTLIIVGSRFIQQTLPR